MSNYNRVPSVSSSPARPLPFARGFVHSSDLVLPSAADMLQSIRRDKYLADPILWLRRRLGEHCWSMQRTIFEAVRDNRRVAVQSCHSVGKSFLQARIALWWLDTHAPGEAFVVTSAATDRQVRAVLWREINRAHAMGQFPGRCNQTEIWLSMPHGNEEIIAFGQKPADLNPTAFQGIHAKFVLVLFDEASGIYSDLWDSADSLISNANSKFVAMGNPDDPTSEFAEVCKPGSGWHTIQISAFDTPNFTGEVISSRMADLLAHPIWAEEKLRKWGESNPLYISKVLGRFPEVTSGGLFPISWIKAAQNRTLTPTDTSISELGVDVGGGGSGKSVIAHRHGDKVRIVHRDHEPDTMVTCGNVIRMLNSTHSSVAKIDSIGIGRGVADRAAELKKPIIAVNVGDPPSDTTQFLNLRAEGYWQLRERFQDGLIDIDEEDDDLAAQLVDLRYKSTSSGRVQIENKDEMRRRGRQSPDESDAVMLAFLKVKTRAKPKLVWRRKRQVKP